MTIKNKTIQEKLQIETTTNDWGNVTTYKTNVGSFSIQLLNENDFYGKPKCVIIPIGYIDELPPISQFRRNNEKQWYTTSTNDIYSTMESFLEKMDKQLEKNDRLYHNN